MSNVKTFRQILSSMVDWFTSNNSRVTSFFVGGVARSMLEAIAIEIESLYYQMFKGFKRASENAIYESFNFAKLPPKAASGVIKLTLRAPLTSSMVIPMGYRVATIPVGGRTIYFSTTSDLLLPVGSLIVNVGVRCTEPGPIGNVPANTIRLPLVRLTQIEDITNESAFIDGRLEESSEARKKRFAMYIDTLPRGTVNSIQYGCLLVPEVTGAAIDDQIGVVRAYVHNANGDLPDSVRSDVKASLVNYRAAGIEVLVLPVQKKLVDLSISVTLQAGFDQTVYEGLIQSEVTKYINNYTVAKSLIRAELIKFIMTIDESAITNTEINLSSDLIVNKSELIRPGTITISTTG